jgi:hypothetical protein
MHLIFQRLAASHDPNQWDEVGKEYAAHHAWALFHIQKCSQSCNKMILQTYTYLRDDAKANSFMDAK